MSLPINIHDLINGQSIEWERLEFKAGWNPETILHTLTAFANDINNWGGGYIIVGVEENNGKPVLPPKGLSHELIDEIQKKLLELCHLISPNYFPVVAPVIYKEKQILIIWCPGGDTRPYKAPEKLAKNSQQKYFIRRFASTVKANREEELQLLQLAAKVPFDDRINHNANFEDLSITLIKEFLKDVGSDLYEIAENMPFPDLCRQMQIVRGPEEYLKPVNIGLLMFNTDPSKFFRGAKIEIVEYHDDVGDSFTEKIFAGPIHHQLKMSLQYIKNSVIKEHIRKIDTQPEAIRVFNYPITAIEEALANAVYHKSYDLQDTVEVSIYKDRIDILSFPGPIPPTSEIDFKKDKVVVRTYRNRRVGDFLKELDLTEGRGTGIPKIRKAMKENNSPEPVFQTDENRSYFLTTFYVSPDLNTNGGLNGGLSGGLSGGLNGGLNGVLVFIRENPGKNTKDISEFLDTPSRTVEKWIAKLRKNKSIEFRGSKKTGGYWEIIENDGN